MKNLTIINACFFLYCFLAGKGFVQQNDFQISQFQPEQSCAKNLFCKISYSNLASKKSSNNKSSHLIPAISNNNFFLDPQAFSAELPHLHAQTLSFPVYLYIKTGLSPPVCS